MDFSLNVLTLLTVYFITKTESKPYCTSASGNALKIANKADDYVGSRNWAYNSKRRTGINTDKDYIFVAEVVEWAKCAVPHRHWYSWSPMTARDWSNANNSDLKSDRCWSLVPANSCYKAGDVVAGKGHVGIVTGEGQVTHADRAKVIKDGWGLQSGDMRLFWRYGC